MNDSTPLKHDEQLAHIRKLYKADFADAVRVLDTVAYRPGNVHDVWVGNVSKRLELVFVDEASGYHFEREDSPAPRLYVQHLIAPRTADSPLTTLFVEDIDDENFYAARRLSWNAITDGIKGWVIDAAQKYIANIP